MWRGRVVRVIDRQSGRLVAVYQVGFHDPACAVAAVLAAHPDLHVHQMCPGGCLDDTTILFPAIRPGEVRDAYEPRLH